MAELVPAIEERTVTWPEKWTARATAKVRAEGFEEVRAIGREKEWMAGSPVPPSALENASRVRFGESVVQSFSQPADFTRQAGAVWGPESLSAICLSVALSGTEEDLIANLHSLRTESA